MKTRQDYEAELAAEHIPGCSYDEDIGRHVVHLAKWLMDKLIDARMERDHPAINTTLVRLKQWMLDRDVMLERQIKDKNERVVGAWVFDLSDSDIQHNEHLRIDINRLEGERQGIRNTLEALNRFAIHPFVEEPIETTSSN